jgi:hypothetical protein
MLIIIFAVAIVVASSMTAYSAKRRRFDAVPTLPGRFIGMPWHRSTGKLIPTPEEITRQKNERRQQYDATDDLLDPKNPGHEKWRAEHPDVTND